MGRARLDNMQQDVRAAVRGLRKSPGFAVVAIGTLALGIGANTALFSIFSSLILRPLPVRDPGSLALLTDVGSWSYPIWREIRAREGELFDGAFAWFPRRLTCRRAASATPSTAPTSAAGSSTCSASQPYGAG